MKRVFLITIAALFAITGCEKETPITEEPINNEDSENVEEPQQVEETQAPEYVTYIFKASLGDDVIDVETKATFARTGTFVWEDDDEIKFFSDGGATYIGTVGDGGTSVSVTVPVGTVLESAIFPAAAGKAKNQVNFDNIGPIVVADASQETLAFHHIGSLVNIKIDGIPEGTTQMVFTTSSSNTYDGSFTFTSHVPELAYSVGESTVTITVPVTPSNSGSDVTLSLPNFALSGFTIALKNDAGRNLYKKSTSKSFDLSVRATLLNMKKLTYAAPKVYYLKTVATQTDFWSQEDMPLIKTGANTFSITANADRMSTYYIYDEWNMDAPTAHCLATGSTTSDTYTEGAFRIYGNFTSPEWDTSKGTLMNKIGSWNYLLNHDGLAKKYFKFYDIANSKVYSTNNGSDYWISAGSVDTGIAENGSKAYYVNSDDALDYYFNPSEGLIVNAKDNKSNPISAVVQYDFNNSTKAVTVTVKDKGSEYPFKDAAFPINTYGFKSSLDSWAELHDMTYDNNWGWQYTFDVASAGTYDFILISSADNYNTRLSTKWGTSNVASNGYGRLAYWDDDANASVSLEVGTYTLYVNPTLAYDHSLNVMFVKH